MTLLAVEIADQGARFSLPTHRARRFCIAKFIVQLLVALGFEQTKGRCLRAAMAGSTCVARSWWVMWCALAWQCKSNAGSATSRLRSCNRCAAAWARMSRG